MAPRTTRSHNHNNTNHGPITHGSNTQRTTRKHGESDPNEPPKGRKTRHVDDNESGKVDNERRAGKSARRAKKAGRKTSAAKNAEVAALRASNRLLPRTERKLEDDGTSLAPPQRTRSATAAGPQPSSDPPASESNIGNTDSNMDSNTASNTDEDDHNVDDHDDHVDDDDNHIGHNNGHIGDDADDNGPADNNDRVDNDAGDVATAITNSNAAAPTTASSASNNNMAAPSASNDNTAASRAAPSALNNDTAASRAAPSASNDNAATSATASASNNNTAATPTAPSASNNNVAAPALNDVAIPAAHDGITDVHMSSPIQPLMGSSQTSGGILCGRARGNFLNHADFMITNLELEGPVKGEVYLYLTDQYPGHINFEFLKGDSELVVLVNVVENMVPILNMVARKFSIIQDQQYHIYYRRSTKWIALGQFDQALEDDDECEWQMSDKQTPELHLLISSYNGPVSGSHYVPSTASRASTVHTPISIPSIPHDSSLSPRQLKIMTALDMDQGLVGTKGSRSSIETIWKQYVTITKAISKVGDVDWVFGSKKPVDSEIISVYGGRSTFYEQSKVLQHVKLYPDMVEWLEQSNSDANATTNLWGFYKPMYTLKDLF
ncbi:hypothetical protein BYT27DRAFT_7263843 [Phlegmacium glaucopus]|nr:hypothetical protein BYT27DRAFT_7263843 [Phlegmacium glaucopus]